jgi:hypothetical protein
MAADGGDMVGHGGAMAADGGDMVGHGGDMVPWCSPLGHWATTTIYLATLVPGLPPNLAVQSLPHGASRPVARNKHAQ